MTLIAILLGLLSEYFVGQLHRLRRYTLLQEYATRVREFLGGGIWEGHAGAILILLPLVLVTAWLQSWLNDGFLGLPGLLFSVVVLIYCLGPRDLKDDVEQYRAAMLKDDAGLAVHLAEELLDTVPPEDPEQQAAMVLRAILTQAHVRLFGVLFWFILLGPTGAILFRATQLLTALPDEYQGQFSAAAEQILAVLAWPSTRLVALGYALSGHFESAIEGWRHHLVQAGHFERQPELLLASVGIGALDVADRPALDIDWYEILHGAMRLVWRTLILWVFVVALATFAGWIA
jgi:membrane protein required for beta-lactamase induction